MIVNVPGCDLPSVGLKETRTFTVAPGAMRAALGELYAASLYAMLEMWRSAAPVFPIWSIDDPVAPLFTTPKSSVSGETAMIGGLTAVACMAAFEASISVRSWPCPAAAAIPGTKAKTRSPRSATLTTARLLIGCPP